MANLDGSGPMGKGPGTGRGMGNCMGVNRVGQGCWRGFGFGRRRFIAPQNELLALEDEERILSEELEIIKSEIKALKNQK